MNDPRPVTPPAPLFRDPVHDGAADPTVIWNRNEQAWWILYTNRRASAPAIGKSWVHGTRIGVASSHDGGETGDPRRSSLQVARLDLDAEGALVCDRDARFALDLGRP